MFQLCNSNPQFFLRRTGGLLCCPLPAAIFQASFTLFCKLVCPVVDLLVAVGICNAAFIELGEIHASHSRCGDAFFGTLIRVPARVNDTTLGHITRRSGQVMLNHLTIFH